METAYVHCQPKEVSPLRVKIYFINENKKCRIWGEAPQVQVAVIQNEK